MNHHVPAGVTSDPDLPHLLDLLAMLPGPVENHEFWIAVQSHNFPTVDAPKYIFEKMSSIWRVLHKPEPTTVSYLARYLLLFFSGGDPKLWETLGAVSTLNLMKDQTGRLWAEDVCMTAWTLYLRYQHHGDDRWKAKWRYEKSWLEWFPERRAD